MVYDIVYQLQSLGVFDILLPFLFIFTLIFGLLEKTHILGKDKKNINAVVAFILGLLFITQFEIVQTMNTFLPKASLFMIIAVMFLLLMAFFGGTFHEGVSKPMLWIVYIIVIIAMYWSLSPSLGLELPYFLTNSDWLGWVVGIGVLLFILYVVVKKQE